MGCRRRAAATELVRVSVEEGRWSLGPGPGRGAWLCPAPGCLTTALRGGRLARALRTIGCPDVADLWDSGHFDPVPARSPGGSRS